MKLASNWVFWIAIIALLILVFPKSCGNKLPSQFLDYACYGFKTPFLSEVQNSDNPSEWCSGICISTSKIKQNLSVSTQDTSGMPSQIKGLTESFGKLVPVMIGIIFVIAILKWFENIKKGKGGAEIRVYRGPGE